MVTSKTLLDHTKAVRNLLIEADCVVSNIDGYREAGYLQRLCERIDEELDSFKIDQPQEQPSSKKKGFVCADCRNVFLQEPRCTTCGAEKLYDTTVRNLQEDNARYESGRVVLTGKIDDLKKKLLAAEQLAARQGNEIRRLRGPVRGERV